MIERSEKQVAQLIRDTGESAHAQSPVARQVADYYNSVMDEGRIEPKGLSPVQPTLRRIEAIKDGVTLASWPGKFGRQ